MKDQLNLSGQTGSMSEPAYNLFRRKPTPDLYCAAPEDRPVPAFIDGATWEYVGTLRHNDAPPSGLERSAAVMGVQLNGFHLFHRVDAASSGASIVLRQPVVDMRTLLENVVKREVSEAWASPLSRISGGDEPLKQSDMRT